MTSKMPPKQFLHLSPHLRLCISALRNRGHDLPGGIHIALETVVPDGFERTATFIVPRPRVAAFFKALEKTEAEAIDCGWWPDDMAGAA